MNVMYIAAFRSKECLILSHDCDDDDNGAGEGDIDGDCDDVGDSGDDVDVDDGDDVDGGADDREMCWLVAEIMLPRSFMAVRRNGACATCSLISVASSVKPWTDSRYKIIALFYPHKTDCAH